MVRSTSDLSAVEDLDLEYVYADVTDADSLPSALQGVDLVFHVAGLTKSRDPRAYFRVNSDGSRALAGACADAGSVRRFVYISSQAAAGPSWKGRARTEDDLPAPVGPYGESKLAGEVACREAIGDRLEYTIVRPSIVYGPWERDMLELFRMAKRRIAFRVLGDTSSSLIHSADLAEVIERSGRMEQAAGRVYSAADPQPYWMRDIIRLIAQVLDRKVLQVPIPPIMLWPFALVNEQFLKAGKGIEMLTRTRLKEMRVRYWASDSTRARTELGWEPGRTLPEGMAETGAWYREKGWL
jgi:nucleoside-diphosphate-sugar epimerase